MQFVFLAIVGLLGWAWWTRKITSQQLPSLALMIIGGVLAARGQFLFGLGAIGVGAAWFVGYKRRASKERSQQFTIDRARFLLGALANDDAEKIRMRHRALMSANHPDKGGSDERAQQLNEARDLLLKELNKRN